MNWPLLKNSLLVGGAVTVCAASLGFLAALFASSLSARWRRWLILLAIIAFAMPPFLVTNCWLDLIGTPGAWGSRLPFNLFSLTGVVCILSLMYWPLTFFAAAGAWRRIMPGQLESDPLLRGRALIRWLLWPMARASVGLSAALTFVLALNHFAVPALLQVKVLPAEVWIAFNTNLSVSAALQAGWPLVVAPLLFLVFLVKKEPHWPRNEGGVSAQLFRLQLGPGWGWSCGGVALLLAVFSVGIPLLELIFNGRTWQEFIPAMQAGASAATNSFCYSATTATLTVGAGLLLARWRAGLWFWMPFFVPGILIGVGLIALFNRPGWDAIYRSQAICVIALGLRYLAPGWQGATMALRGMDRDLLDLARLDGMNAWQKFRHVLWPQTAPQLAATWYGVYVLSLWDVETLILIQPPGGETLAIRVFNLLHYGHAAQVNALCLMLLLLAPLPLAGWAVWKMAARWMAARNG